jgi:predicted O-methyltransferase YrrM
MIRIEEICTANEMTIHLRKWRKDLRAGGLLDSTTLAILAHAKRPEVYFEIGTGDGRSALLVATNTPASTQIITLDVGYPQESVKGTVFRGEPEAARIQQLGGSSDRFDFSQWEGKADLVFVDGGHDYKDVVNDTRAAFRLLAPGGWILWHDVAHDHPGVVKALEQHTMAGSIFLIQGTRYAIHRS